jgi:uncharacterized protein (TIGR02598 family)
MRFSQKNRVNPQNKGARPSRPRGDWSTCSRPPEPKSPLALTGETPVPLFKNFFTTVANSRSGFSLIEVTIAIGIVGFAVLALLGTLGVGSRALGSAVSYSMQAQITQNVMGSLKLSDFTMLTNNSPNGWNGANLYFDERGVSVATPSLAIYTANITVTNNVNGNTNLARAILSIVKNSNTNDTYTVATYIANNGQ